MNHIGERLAPEAWEQIQVADEPTWQQVGASLREEARRAKNVVVAPVRRSVVAAARRPGAAADHRATSSSRSSGPYIDETVSLLRRCITDAGVDESKVASIYLVGGASRSPIVERLVRNAFSGVAVSRRGDPKASVALGAARAVRSGGPGASGSSRTTQEASPNTADQPLVPRPAVRAERRARPLQPAGSAPPVSDPGGSSRPTPHPAATRARRAAPRRFRGSREAIRARRAGPPRTPASRSPRPASRPTRPPPAPVRTRRAHAAGARTDQAPPSVGGGRTFPRDGRRWQRRWNVGAVIPVRCCDARRSRGAAARRRVVAEDACSGGASPPSVVGVVDRRAPRSRPAAPARGRARPPTPDDQPTAPDDHLPTEDELNDAVSDRAARWPRTSPDDLEPHRGSRPDGSPATRSATSRRR